MKRSFDVIHAIPSLAVGGMERFVLSLSETQSGDIESSIVCTAERGVLWETARASGIRTDFVPSPLIDNWFPSALTTLLKTRAPAVVHSHSGSWLKAARAAQHAGVRRVVHTMHGFHEGREWLHRPLERSAASLTHVVVAVSDELRAYASSALGVPSEKLVVLSNGIDAPSFSGAASRRRARNQLSPNDVVIGFVGRLAAVKAPLVLLEAFAEVLRLGGERHPDLRISLQFIGSGPLSDELEIRILANNLTDSVRLVGSVNNVCEHLPGIDIFCLPSHSEGTSIALLEAMASGCAVVATDVGGTRAVLDDGVAGALVAPNDVSALAVALWRFVENPQSRQEFGQRAQVRVNTHYSIAATASAYHDLYSQIP